MAHCRAWAYMRRFIRMSVDGSTDGIQGGTLNVTRRPSSATTTTSQPSPRRRPTIDDAFIYKESIDLGTYERQRDRLREELTLVEIDRHGSKVEEFDVEGILNFAERVLPRASDLWIQAIVGAAAKT